MTSSLLSTVSSACGGIMKPHFIPTIMLVILSLVVVPYSFYVTSQKRQILINKITMNNTGFRAHGKTTYKILSAFHEETSPGDIVKKIRILGFHHMSDTLPVYCKLIAIDGTTFCLANHAAKEMMLNYEGKYSADREIFVTCTYKVKADIIGVSLSFSNDCDDGGPVIHVENPVQSKQFHDVHLCVMGYPRMTFTNDTFRQLQLWKQYGVNNIDIYTSPIEDDITQHLLAVLKNSMELRHHIWAPGDRALHKYGYTLAMNDCFYRYRHSTKFIMYLDVRYFLFLQNSTNLSEFFQRLAKDANSPFIIDSYSLENLSLDSFCRNMSAGQFVDVTTKLSQDVANIVYPSNAKFPITLPEEVMNNQNNVVRVFNEQAVFLKFSPSYFRGENMTVKLNNERVKGMCRYLDLQ